MGGDVPSPQGVGLQCAPLSENLFEFSSYKAGLYAFLLRKTACGQKPGLGRFIDPLGP